MAKPAEIPYYPSEVYLRRNWAPEHIPADSLAALARAEARAVATGVLSPTLAGSFLANSLVEGRSGARPRAGQRQVPAPDFGLNSLDYPRDQRLETSMRQMGLSVGPPAQEAPPESQDWGDTEWAKWDRGQKNPDVLRLGAESGKAGYMMAFDPEGEYGPKDLAKAAALSAVALGHKARLYGEELAIERWNGIGPPAKAHAAKVAEMQRLLSDPANAQIAGIYQRALAAAMQAIAPSPAPQSPPGMLGVPLGLLP